MKGRLNHITFLQFIGPIFVILGHSINGMPSNDAYYTFAKEWIYVFHMPLFFFISGYLFSFKDGLENKSYGKFILAKFQRLLIPYLVWNFLFIIPKILMSNFLVDNVEFSLSKILKLIITPRAMIWGHTWFLAALFLLFLLAPIFNIIMRSEKNKVLVWAGVTIILAAWYLLPSDNILLALSDLSKDTLFFWIGIMLGQVSLDRLRYFVAKPKITISIIAVTGVLTFIRLEITDLLIISMLTCLFTIITLFIIPLFFNINSGLIDEIGGYSFGIYILHWPVMVTIRILFYQIMDISSGIVIFIMAVCGFVVPYFIVLVLKRFESEKFENPKRYLFGI
jgi:fucose 4-O-acetylase-like acetyltransferase